MSSRWKLYPYSPWSPSVPHSYGIPHGGDKLISWKWKKCTIYFVFLSSRVDFALTILTCYTDIFRWKCRRLQTKTVLKATRFEEVPSERGSWCVLDVKISSLSAMYKNAKMINSLKKFPAALSESPRKRPRTKKTAALKLWCNASRTYLLFAS